MTTILTLSIITSILVLGVTIVTQEGMALYRLRAWAEEKDTKILEPLILCHWCMPSVYSLIGYIFAFATGILTQLRVSLILMYPLVVGLSSIICGITWSLYLLIESATEYYKIKQNEHQKNS